MKIEHILTAEQEALRFLQKIKELKNHSYNGKRISAIESGAEVDKYETTTERCKESAALKRSSMDLTNALSKMRTDTW